MKNKSKQFLAYHGGGYDGCIWEPNFALVYDNRVWDCGSSGYAGLFKGGFPNARYTAKKSLFELLKGEKFVEDISGIFYDLDNLDDLKSLFKRWRNDHVLYALREAEGVIDNESLYGICGYCNEKSLLEELILPEELAHGDGGIGIVIDDCICSQCYSDGSCSNCDSFVGSNGLVNGVCDYCFDDIKNQQAREKLKDDPAIAELEKAIITGKKQLKIMCELKPQFAVKFNIEHKRSVREIEEEINEIVKGYTDDKDNRWEKI